MNRRLAAVASFLLLATSVVLAVVVGVQRFPRGLSVLACLVAALGAAWWALTHRGAARAAGVTGAGVLLAGAVVLVATEARVLQDALILASFLLSVEASRRVFAVHAKLPPAPPPKRPVLFYNPKSGGGKAERFHVAREARARGVEPVELHLGDDLAALVRDAIENGADAVGVAGGDGTQAIVAGIAAERGLPYVCVPAGTRNHFALDLGVDRTDVVGALDAFTKGGERVVDLAEVSGRVFVNNVSLGVYAEAVQSGGYRDAKLRTIADTAPAVLGTDEGGLGLRWTGADGQEHETGARALDRVWTPVCSASRSPESTLTSTSRSGPQKRSRFAATARSRPASTARPPSSSPRFGFAPGHRLSECGSLRSIRAPPHQPRCRTVGAA